MPELRKDPATERWVIISHERGKRPILPSEEQAPAPPRACPFCPGHESKTPPAILSYCGADGAWQLRVVPSKHPVLQVEAAADRRGQGPYDLMNGLGAHEVVIESPQHHGDLDAMGPEQVERVLLAWRDRSLDLRRDLRMRYILAFRNHGTASGAGAEHPHSQIIATPVVPKRVAEKLAGARAWYALKERCLFCDILRYEAEVRERVVAESEHFVVLAPFAAGFPFELAIYPKQHAHDFGALERPASLDLARLLRESLRRLKRALGGPAYSIILHTAPLAEPCQQEFHWHLEIIPLLTQMAGFEQGSGFYINPTAPEEAAQYLRQVEL
jgi:UDPglucose--hexose-1-phosphate uridylyltransferase